MIIWKLGTRYRMSIDVRLRQMWVSWSANSSWLPPSCTFRSVYWHNRMKVSSQLLKTRIHLRHIYKKMISFSRLLSVSAGRRGERKVPSKAKLVEVLFCLSGCVFSVNKHKYQSKYLAMEHIRKSQLMLSNVQTKAWLFSQTHEIHKCSLYEITAVSDR